MAITSRFAVGDASAGAAAVSIPLVADAIRNAARPGRPAGSAATRPRPAGTRLAASPAAARNEGDEAGVDDQQRLPAVGSRNAATAAVDKQWWAKARRHSILGPASSSGQSGTRAGGHRRRPSKDLAAYTILVVLVS